MLEDSCVHESGMIRKLISLADAEANKQNGKLRAIHIRLGALAGGSVEHIRDHFEIELQRRGLEEIRLDITEAPLHPAAIEVTSIEVVK